MRTLARLLLVFLGLELTLRVLVEIDPVRERLTSPTEDIAGQIAWAWRTKTDGEQVQGAFDVRDDYVAFDADLGWTSGRGRSLDAHGLRDGGAVTAPGARRIALIGDSFAWGFGAPADHTFAHLLEVRRPDVDVLNLGVVGYGLDQAVLRLERDAGALHPDVVVLLATDTLIARSYRSFDGYAKPWFSLEDGSLAPHGVPVDPPERLRSSTRWRTPATLLVADLAAWRYRRRVHPHPPIGAPSPLVDALLDRWLADVRAIGAEPLLLAAPTPNEQGRTPSPGLEANAFRAWCARQPGVCVDGWPWLLARAPDPASVADPSLHWNDHGHALVAELLEGALVQVGALAPVGASSP